jgi:hypothetical protein
VNPVAESHPLAATLGRVSALDEYLALELGTGEGDGWIAATELGAALPTILRRVGEDAGTDDRRIQAALFVWSYAWKVAAPAIACYLVERRVPDVGPGNVAVRIDGGGGVRALALRSARFAELADGPASVRGALPLAGDAELLAWLRGRLEVHLALAVGAVRACSPIGRRAPWALAADACADAFLHVGKKLGREDDSCLEAETFLEPRSGSRLRSRASFFTLERAGRHETFLRRASCCLYYKVPGGEYCATCPLLSEPERERRLRAELERSAG